MARSVNPGDAMGDDVMANLRNAPPKMKGRGRRRRRKSKRY